MWYVYQLLLQASVETVGDICEIKRTSDINMEQLLKSGIISSYLDTSETTEHVLVLSLYSWDFLPVKDIIHRLALALRQHFANRL